MKSWNTWKQRNTIPKKNFFWRNTIPVTNGGSGAVFGMSDCLCTVVYPWWLFAWPPNCIETLDQAISLGRNYEGNSSYHHHIFCKQKHVSEMVVPRIWGYLRIIISGELEIWQICHVLLLTFAIDDGNSSYLHSSSPVHFMFVSSCWSPKWTDFDWWFCFKANNTFPAFAYLLKGRRCPLWLV